MDNHQNFPVPRAADSSPPSGRHGVASQNNNPIHRKRLNTLRLVSMVSLLLLILLCLVWELWLYPTGSGFLVFKALPLCFAIIGIVRHRMYTYRWLSLLLWLYVLEGGVRIYSPSAMESVLALLEILLSITLFLFCVFYIRGRLGLDLGPASELGEKT